MASNGVFFVNIAQLRDFFGHFAKWSDELALPRATEAMQDLGPRALQIVREEAPKQTGNFAAGLQVVPYGRIGFAIISDDPALLKDLIEGTGIYRAGGSMIVATRSPVMVFEAARWPQAAMGPNGGNGLFVFKTTRGQAANRFDERARDRIMEQETVDMMSRIANGWVADLGYGRVF